MQLCANVRLQCAQQSAGDVPLSQHGVMAAVLQHVVELKVKTIF